MRHKKTTFGNTRLRSETGIVLILVLLLLAVISLISIHKMKQMLLTSKTSASLRQQLLTAVENQNRLVEAELRVQKNPEKYPQQLVGFVPDHLAFGCEEGVEIFKVTMPPLESFIIVRRRESEKPLTLTQLLAKARAIKDPLKVLDVRGEGVCLYFLGESKGQKGLIMVRESLNGTKEEPACIVEGDFHSFFIRYGRLILVATDLRNDPILLDLSSHQPIPATWKHEFSNMSSEASTGVVTGATIIWDPIAQQENLIILNATCQLIFFTSHALQDKYGRSAWRESCLSKKNLF